jgi:hypothetical protein
MNPLGRCDYPMNSHLRSPALLATIALGTTFSAACQGVDPPLPGEPSSTSQAPDSTTEAPLPPGTATTAPSDTSTSAPASTSVGTTEDETGSGIKLDVGNGQDQNDIEITGRVLAPNGEIPIAGALVYLTANPPEGVPEGVYCDECQALAPEEFYATTLPNGTFQLIASSSMLPDSELFLVTRKAQFMRIVPFDPQIGEQAVDEALTQLPGQHDPASGRWIPRIAVYETYPDEVFNVLAKFGLGQASVAGTLIPGTEQFTLISDSDQGAFLDDLTEMSQYHIIFVPCATTVFWPMAGTVPPQRLANIQDYVAAGGKLYATDHANEYIKQPFPDYFDLYSPAMPDIQPAYTVDGTVEDPGLLAWLSALPPELADIGGGNPTLANLPLIELHDNFTGIDAVHDVLVPDDEGDLVNVGPHTWVSGPCTSCVANPVVSRPMAITGQYGCGRMMYSTFENSSTAHEGLNPQELVLLYMILEIGVCQEDLLPPPQN